MTQSSPSPQSAPAPRRRLWLRVLLFVSLALNLAVAGVVVGALIKFSDAPDQPQRISRELGLGPFVYALDDQNREALYDSTRARRSELAEGRRAWRSAISETLVLLREEPFDEARFMELVRRQADIASRGRMIGQEELARQLAAMTPEARAAFADKLERGMRFGERHRGGPGRGLGNGPPKPPESQP